MLEHHGTKNERDAETRGNRYTTPGGYHRLLRKIEVAKEAYFEVCRSNEDAAGAGDTSVYHDNFAYEENQRQMHQLSRRVRDMETLLSHTHVIDIDSVVGRKVSLGTVVILSIGELEQEITYMIGGYDDGSRDVGRIAYNAPLGRKLIGRKKGNVVNINVDGRPIRAVIVMIRKVSEAEDAAGE